MVQLDSSFLNVYGIKVKRKVRFGSRACNGDFVRLFQKKMNQL